MTATPEQATQAANEVFGTHPGYRALHAKGVLLKGTFTATPYASHLTRAGHMQGEPVPVTVRVSNGGGDPDVPDYAPDVRGLAIKFYLPDGSRTDIVAQSAPRFPVRTPEAFVELLVAQKPGPAMAWKVPAFLARHPEAIPKLLANVPALRPVASYATCRYYAIHAYRFVAAEAANATSATRSSPRRATSASARARPSDAAATTSTTRSSSGWSAPRFASRSSSRSPLRETTSTIPPRRGPRSASA